MSEVKVTFDAAAYERFMGRWSRAVGEKFLAWLAAPNNATWLDVGCGTGAFTGLILKNCTPAAGLRANLRSTLPIAPDGSISYSARATAFKARKPV